MTQEDIRRLQDQYEFEKKYDLFRKNEPKYENVNEWWAEKIRSIVEKEAGVPVRESNPAFNQFPEQMAKTLRALVNIYHSFIDALLRLGKKDHAAAIYQEILKLERLHGDIMYPKGNSPGREMMRGTTR